MTRAAALLLLAGCPVDPVVVDDTAVPLLEGPVITHEPPQGPFLEGGVVGIEATAEDPDGVESMQVLYRTGGELPYRLVEMDFAEDGVFRATLQGSEVNAPAFEYYLRAFDLSDFRVPADFPATGPDAPLSLQVDVVPLDVPYLQPFDGTVTSFGVYELGWTEFSLGFRGVRWKVRAEEGLSGGAAVHSEGFDGIDSVDDWLVSPVLDFSALSTAEVRFSQYGERVDQIGEHSLWISTGSADPQVGDFVQLAELPAPDEGRWSQVPVIDLSPWAGQDSVVLAWRYQGAFSDLWAVDEVRVRAFGPDLQLVSVELPRLDPGSVGVMEVELLNLGAPTQGPVTLTGSADPTRMGFPLPVDLGVLSTGQSIIAPLRYAVASDHPDNTALPVVLDATDGLDGASWPVELLVGDETRGIFRLQTLQPGIIRMSVGTGNPLQPHAEERVFLGSRPAGVHSFEVDLSEHIDFLPSEPGRLRWWVRIETDSPGSLLGFGIDFDGQVEWTETVGPYPGGEEVLFYLPGRAQPVLDGAFSVPDPIAPGSEAALSFTLRNEGGWTTGRTRVRFSTLDPDLVVLGADAVLSGSAGWAPGAVSVVSVPVSIAAGHTNSAPIPLQLTIADDLEVFPIDLQVPIPWPDVALGAGVVVDPAGNADGVLDPGETVNFVVQVRNDGALATDPLSCTLTQTGGPTITLDTAVAALGELAPGGSADASFQLTASAGALGDELVFAARCEDGRDRWDAVLSVLIGGGGWTPLPLDPIGDAAAGSPMDLRDGRWRVDGDVLFLELTSATPIDPATLAFEVWGLSAGSVWTQHAITVQGGTAQLFGIQFGGFNPLGDVPLTIVDADTVRLEIDLPMMQLAVDEFAFGVGAGFCPTGALYCDHWPDGWGDPYSGPLDTTLWHLISW